MNKPLAALFALVFAYFSVSACVAQAEQSPATPFAAYFKALAATTHGESSASDVEAVLSFYADDIVYEHPGVGIRLEGKQAQRQGMLAFLASYAGGASDSTIDVMEVIEGRDVMLLRLNVRFLLQRDDAIEAVSREQVRVIETRDGKIKRIIDYW